MTELDFCRQFLSALDARPRKIPSDHIADPRRYPAQGAYTLPRLPHPPHPARPNPKPSQHIPSTASEIPGASKSLNITMHPMKSTFSSHSLPSMDPATTSIFDLKSAYAQQTSIPTAKIKILYKKKPATDSKTVAEVIGQDGAGGDVEFTVMVLGGATAASSGAASPSAATPATSPPAAAPLEAEKAVGGPAAQGPSGKEVVATPEFWDDLKGFMFQRIRDEEEGERLVGVFKAAWEKSR